MELFSRRFFKENFFEFLLELGSVSGILFFFTYLPVALQFLQVRVSQGYIIYFRPNHRHSRMHVNNVSVLIIMLILIFVPSWIIRQGNWTELTFAMTSGTFTKDKEKPLASSRPARPKEQSQKQLRDTFRLQFPSQFLSGKQASVHFKDERLVFIRHKPKAVEQFCSGRQSLL